MKDSNLYLVFEGKSIAIELEFLDQGCDNALRFKLVKVNGKNDFAGMQKELDMAYQQSILENFLVSNKTHDELRKVSTSISDITLPESVLVHLIERVEKSYR